MAASNDGMHASEFEMFPAKHGVAVRLSAACLGLLWASLVVACDQRATEPIDTARRSRLSFIVQPINTTAGATLSPSIQVAEQDSDGNTVSTFAGTVTIALGTNPGRGSLTGTKVVHASNGIATFPDLSIDVAANGYTLVARTSGLDAVTSNAFNTVPVCHTNNCWTTKAAVPTVRRGFVVGSVAGMLYTLGGAIGFTPPDALWSGSGTVEAYDPNTNRWTASASMVTGGSGGGVVEVNGLLYAVGGDEIAEDLAAYDPVANTWTIKQHLPNPQLGLGVGVVNGIIYAVGGLSTPWGPVTGTVEAYDPVSNTWTAKAPMPKPLFPPFAVGVVNGILYAVGGDPAGTVEAYDPMSDTWTIKQPMLTPRSGFGVGVVNGVLYAVGGKPAGYDAVSILNTVEAYDPTTNTWTTRAPMLTARYALGVGVLNGVLYALGGSRASGESTGANEAYRP